MTSAHKWRKAWVAPHGTQPESTYKVCRWVKIAKDDKVRLSPFLQSREPDMKLMEKDVEDEAAEDGDEEEEGDEEEGEDEGEGEGEGEGEDAEGEEGKTPAVEADVAMGTDTPANPEPSSSIGPTPTALASELTPPSSDAPAPVPVPAAIPVGETSTAPVEETSSATSLAPALSEPTTIEAAHTAIPSNAIEMTNTAPNHVDDGNPISSTQEVGIEITKPPSPIPQQEVEAAPTVIGSLGQNEDKMEVDEPDVEKGEAVEEDVGLVMGEMTPPVGEKELEVPVQDGDAVKETEEERGDEIVAESSTQV